MMTIGLPQLETILSVRQAAQGLTLACTDYVGPVSMALSLRSAPSLGDRVPTAMHRKIDALGEKEKNGDG